MEVLNKEYYVICGKRYQVDDGSFDYEYSFDKTFKSYDQALRLFNKREVKEHNDFVELIYSPDGGVINETLLIKVYKED